MRARRIASAAVAALIAVTGAACTATAPPAGAPATASVDGTGGTSTAAPAYGATLDATQFAASLQTPGVTILDVRTPAEYAAGHLEGAVLADVNGDFETVLADLDRSTPYAVYCRSGNRSATALATMKKLGFSNAWHLGGGIGAWQAAGMDVVTGS